MRSASRAPLHQMLMCCCIDFRPFPSASDRARAPLINYYSSHIDAGGARACVFVPFCSRERSVQGCAIRYSRDEAPLVVRRVVVWRIAPSHHARNRKISKSSPASTTYKKQNQHTFEDKFVLCRWYVSSMNETTHKLYTISPTVHHLRCAYRFYLDLLLLYACYRTTRASYLFSQWKRGLVLLYSL